MEEFIDINNSLLQREYKKIFSGTNQYGGYDKPFLSYETQTHSVVLKKDTMTYFNTPIYSQTYDITSAALIENGAVMGVTPFYADRIYNKDKDCKDITLSDNVTIRSANSIKLCTWLSGNPSIPSATPIWVDRYYNPDCVDEFNAHLSTNTTSVSDFQSKLVINPASWYAYYHIGEKSILGFTNELSSANALKINIFASDNTLINDSSIPISIFNTNKLSSQYITKYNERNEQNENIVYYSSDIKQTFNIPFDKNYTPSGSFTYNLWTKFNTDNFPGKQIIGQGFRDGWSLSYDNNFYNPIMFFVNNTGQLSISYNTDGDALNRSDTPNIISPIKVICDNDSYGWVLDSGIYEGYKHIYKLDYEGNVIDKIDLNPSWTVKDIKIDRDGNIRLLAQNGGSHIIVKYNRFGNYIDQTTTSSSNYLDIDLNNNNIVSNSYFIINSNNTTYNFNQIKNLCTGLSAVNPTDVIDFNIDKDDNIWLLDKYNYVYKINKNFNLKLNFKIQSATINLTKGTVNFTHELNYNNKTYTDYVWFLCSNDGTLYKYDTNGIIVKKIPIKNFDLDVPISNSDFTNYQWSRKFNYLFRNKTPQIKTSIELSTSTNSPTSTRYNLYCPATFISDNDWHMMTFVFDKLNSKIYFYLDGVLRSQGTTLPNQVVHYLFDSGIVFGANCGKNDIFENSIKTNQDWFEGYLYNFRMYHTALLDYQIQYLHLSRYLYEDIIWYPLYNFKTYLDEIERFFRHKMPGSKSQFYNIKLTGLKITDPGLRLLIEDIIKNTIKKITPAHTILYKIIWD